MSGLTYLPPADGAGAIEQYRVQVSADGTTWSAPVATGTFADDDLLKTVTISSTITRFVRLTAMNGDQAAAAELNLLGGTDPVLPRTGWTATADSYETRAGSLSPANALDGNTATIWHTQWRITPPKPCRKTSTASSIRPLSARAQVSRPSLFAASRIPLSGAMLRIRR